MELNELIDGLMEDLDMHREADRPKQGSAPIESMREFFTIVYYRLTMYASNDGARLYLLGLLLDIYKLLPSRPTVEEVEAFGYENAVKLVELRKAERVRVAALKAGIEL